MKHLLYAAIIAVSVLVIACTPKTGQKTASTPNRPDDTTAWDTIGKPLLGEGDSDAPLEYNALDEVQVEPGTQVNLDSLRP